MAVFVWAGAVETTVGTLVVKIMYALSVRSLFFEEKRDVKILAREVLIYFCACCLAAGVGKGHVLLLKSVGQRVDIVYRKLYCVG